MPQLRYFSLEAFLAHYRALKKSAAPSPADQERLAAMEQILTRLGPHDRQAIMSESHGAEERRQRQRAELKLARMLAADGVLSG